jgi:GNAT superfamily N-acetyltransferase
MLEHASERLAIEGCTVAVGPMDGSTFRHYRFVTEHTFQGERRPRFFLEPDNPISWPTHFLRAGFSPLAHYVSAVVDLGADDPHLSELAARIADAGISVRPVNLDDWQLEMERIYHIVSVSFAKNFLFMPINADEFVAQYRSVLAHIRPQLVTIAEGDGRAVGFMFAIPDMAQGQRGERVDTVILKTVAVLPDAGGIGLGGYLVAQCQQTARMMGFTHAIHALMHEENLSLAISGRYGRLMRRYALFSRPLTGAAVKSGAIHEPISNAHPPGPIAA